MDKVDEFFADIKKLRLGLAYNDVLVFPQESEILPPQTDTSTKFSRNVPLKIPIISAAMDTVTEHKMAILMAQLGGIGVIHKNLTIDDQVAEVDKVKHYLNGLIRKPITITPNMTFQEVEDLKQEKEYSFNSFPVVDENHKLVGLITGADFEFCDVKETPVSQSMLEKVVSAPNDTSIERAYELMQENKVKILPLVDDGRVAGMYTLKDVKRIVKGELGKMNIDSNNQLYVAAAVGVHDDERVEALIRRGVNAIVVDTAHGHSLGVIEATKRYKSEFDIDVVAGNICTEQAARALLDAGADAIKVGVGPGSICTTRVQTARGRAQLTAVYECAKAVRESDIGVIADGGIQQPGHITVALSAGAYSVMLGSLLAGTKESPGDIMPEDGKLWKKYRGMGSLEAMQANEGSRERYGQGKNEGIDLIPEGVPSRVLYKGPGKEVITLYNGSLRSSMGYTGARTLDEFRKNAEFERVTPAGLAESKPHSVMVTEEARSFKED